jgi:hypothetical protein
MKHDVAAASLVYRECFASLRCVANSSAVPALSVDICAHLRSRRCVFMRACVWVACGWRVGGVWVACVACRELRDASTAPDLEKEAVYASLVNSLAIGALHTYDVRDAILLLEVRLCLPPRLCCVSVSLTVPPAARVLCLCSDRTPFAATPCTTSARSSVSTSVCCTVSAGTPAPRVARSSCSSASRTSTACRTFQSRAFASLADNNSSAGLLDGNTD